MEAKNNQSEERMERVEPQKMTGKEGGGEKKMRCRTGVMSSESNETRLCSLLGARREIMSVRIASSWYGA
jgi:hypothetical protein